MTDPVTLVCVFILAVLLVAIVVGRVDVVGGIIAAAFIVLLMVLFGPTFHR